jgi:hypothetical protein
MARAELPDDDYDPFEEFNRSSGMGLVDDPYPLYAMVRAEHPIKREDIGDAVVVPDSDIEFMPLDTSVGVFTAYSYEAVQQVLKDGEDLLLRGLRGSHGRSARPFHPRDGRT